MAGIVYVSHIQFGNKDDPLVIMSNFEYSSSFQHTALHDILQL